MGESVQTGYSCESGFLWVDFPLSIAAEGRDFERAAWLLSQDQRPTVVHHEKERFHGSAKFKFLAAFLVLLR